MQNQTIEGFRLSSQQKQVWRLEEAGARPLAQCVLRLEGDVDSERLRQAVRDVVARHEALRTTYVRLPGMDVPLQVVADEGSVVWTDGDGFGASDAAVAAAQCRESEAGIDLERGPVIRCAVVAVAPGEQALVITTSALAADAWSLRQIATDIAAAYGGTACGDSVVQYVQFSEWQRELAEAEEGVAAREYWRLRCDAEAAGEPLRLPGEGEGAGDAIEAFTLSVPPEQARTGADAARRAGIPEDAWWLAGWQALWHRLTGARDVSLKVQADNRKWKELQEAIGVFVWHVPIQVRCDGGLEMAQFSERVSRALAEAQSHQEYYAPATGSPAPDTIGFAYEVWPEAVSACGVRFTLEEARARTEHFELLLTVSRVGESLRLRLEFDPGRYRREDAGALLERLLTLMESAALDPRQAVSRLPVVGPQERRRLLEEWNATSRERDAASGLHRRFEAQVERTPEAEAVVCGGDRLRYRELNARANRLARALRARGVGRESRVGLLLERSAEAVVSILAVLKAGAAYVPVDPSYPRRRVDLMMSDARVEVVLTEEGLRDRVPAGVGAVVCLDAERARLELEAATNLDVDVDGAALAYVIYTSGSTGTPKGVMVSHGSVENLHAALESSVYAGLGGGRRVSLNAPLSFDASVKQWIQLLSGHTVVVIPEEFRRDPEALVGHLEAEGVEVLDTTPTQLRMLREAGLGCAGGLRTVLVGGEALDAGLWEELSKDAGVSYFNVYGPTECTVDVTAERIEGGAPVLGRPLTNVTAYVLDADQELVATGCVGELYVGGAGVARGYWSRPEVTAERFVPHPFAGEGERLYRTGDRVRRTGTGSLEYVGRVDHQVKLRGFRIELGEIESALREHPGVKEAVVVARADAGEPRLVAYVTPRGAAARREGAATGHRLPNGLRIQHRNRNETEYLYDEIFVKRTYFRHGIQLGRGAVVFDVGANIGMFTLFVCQRWPEVQVHAFEPLPPLRETVEANVSRYGAQVRVHGWGASDREREEEFTFYPRYTMMSSQSRYADAGSEVEVIKRYLANEGDRGVAPSQELLAQADELLEGRFVEERHRCRLRPLSSVIAEEGVSRIDLLKVDVQRAELDVLRGLTAADWSRVQQVVMEAHDAAGTESEGRVAELLSLLREQGFDAVAEQDDLLTGTDRYNVYAVRPGLVWEESEAEREAGEARLRASDEDLSAGRLREHVRERVPEYMVPSAWVVLEELPLTRHGKVDRAALPAPEAAEVEASPVRGARTPVEEILVGLWRDVLRVEQVDVGASFFDLGGHSLLATQLISRVREAFGVELPLRALFEQPTVSGLGERVEECLRSGQGVALPPIRAGERRSRVPLSFAQQRLWFLDQLEPGTYFYNSPSAVRLKGRLDVEALERTLNEIVRRHEVLRTSFGTVDGEAVQEIAPELTLLLPIVDLSARGEAEREEEVLRLAGEEARRPFDLTQAPLLRARLLRLGPEEHIALFTMHHIVSDGWSMGVLVQEIAALYAAYTEGRESPLPDLPLQYADYAVWQRAHLAGETMDEQLAYWRRSLGGPLPVLDLPTDRPRPTVPTYRGTTRYFAVSRELTAAIEELSRREGATVFMTLLAGFAGTLTRLSRHEDVVIGTPIAGRNRIEVEPLIGFFVNTLALRVDLSGNPSFRELLRRVRDVTLGAYAHQDVPFERLVEELQPDRSASRMPLFQVAFGMQNVPREGLRLGDLELARVGLKHESVRFDLALIWGQTSGRTLNAGWTYSTELYDDGRILGMHARYQALLQSALAQPDLGLHALEMVTEDERREQARQARARKGSNLKKFKSVVPKATLQR